MSAPLLVVDFLPETLERERSHVRPAPRATHTPRHIVLSWNGGRCVYCGRKATSVDHIVPVSRGGSGDSRNLAPACQACNSSKGSRLLEEWRPGLAVTMLR